MSMTKVHIMNILGIVRNEMLDTGLDDLAEEVREVQEKLYPLINPNCKDKEMKNRIIEGK